MARSFDTVNGRIAVSIVSLQSNDWTFGAMICPQGAGEANSGQIINSTQSGLRVGGSTNLDLRSVQAFNTTNATATSNEFVTAGTWYAAFATFRVSDSKVRMFFAPLVGTTAVAEVTYASQVAGVGTRSTGTTTHNIGNNAGTTNTFNGQIAHAFIDTREWTLNDMEMFRLGWRPVGDGMRGYWPLDSPTVSQAEDLSVWGAHGTVSGGCTLAEEPPVLSFWNAGVLRVLQPPPSQQATFAAAALTLGAFDTTRTAGSTTRTLEASTLTLTGRDASLALGGVSRTLDATNLTLTANDATRTPATVTRTPDPANLSLTGRDFSTTAGAVSRTLDAGALTLTARDASIGSFIARTFEPASLVLTARDTTRTAGAVTHTPEAANLVLTARDLARVAGATSREFEAAAMLLTALDMASAILGDRVAVRILLGFAGIPQTVVLADRTITVAGPVDVTDVRED